MKLWEQAYEREQGAPATMEAKNSSTTYAALQTRHKLAASQLQELQAEVEADKEKEAEKASLDSRLPPSASTATAPRKRMAVSAEASGGGKAGGGAGGGGGGGGGRGGGRRGKSGGKRPRSAAAIAAIEKASLECFMLQALSPEDPEPSLNPSPNPSPSPSPCPSPSPNLYTKPNPKPNPTPNQALSPEDLRDLMSQMFEVEAQADQVLIAEGDVDADNFYIVQGGKYEVTLLRRPGEVVHTYRNPGESFGELALLYNCPRAATVRCTRGGTLWALDRATFRDVLCGSKVDETQATAAFLGAVPLFSSLTPEQISQLASEVRSHSVSTGAFVVREGERADSLFFVREGQVVCKRRGADDSLAVLGPLDCFGESALHEDAAQAIRKADVVGYGDATVLELHASVFRRLLGSSLEAVVDFNFRKHLVASVQLRGVTLGSILTAAELRWVVDALEEEVWEDGQMRAASPNTLHLLLRGRASVGMRGLAGKTEVVAMQEGDYFGEASLMGGDAPYDSPLHTMTVAAKGTLVCLTVERHAASTLLGSLQVCACGPSLEWY